MPALVFDYTGAEQQLVVPPNVTSLDVVAEGAQGGDGYGEAGGLGGRVTATIPVTPGETLRLFVGGRGGYNGGGAAGADATVMTCTGGGATDIRRGGATLAGRILIAGGGGAAGGGYVGNVGQRGGAGGYVGEQGSRPTGGGGGGTQAGGGTAYEAGHQGALGVGGAGSQFGGGGGGGGYYGGGGGYGSAGSTGDWGGSGGGGGSSWCGTAATYVTGARAGNGRLTITYNRAPSAPGVPTITPSPVNAVGTIAWTASADEDADALTYTVQGSPDNGATWVPLVGPTAALSATYDFTAVPSTTAAKLRVRAYDGTTYSAWATMPGTFTVQHNQAPTAATNLSPANNNSVDRTQPQRLSWTFTDPDTGDTQSRFDLRWRIGAGAWTTVTGTTPNAFYDAAAAYFPAGTVEWQVLTYDSQGVASPWSASAFFLSATPPTDVTITSPTNGSIIATSAAVLAWSAPTQQSYQVRKLADNAGAPADPAVPANVYYDSGEVVTTTARNAALTFPTNARYEHLQVRIKVSGLWSAWLSVRVQVSYTPPPVPVLTVTSDTPNGRIAVAIVNPAPGGTQPALASNEVWRRVVGDTGDGTRLAVAVTGNSTWLDRGPASGVAYQYRVIANAANGTTSASAWTT